MERWSSRQRCGVRDPCPALRNGGPGSAWYKDECMLALSCLTQRQRTAALHNLADTHRPFPLGFRSQSSAFRRFGCGVIYPDCVNAEL
jgi:hypothetical protein